MVFNIDEKMSKISSNQFIVQSVYKHEDASSAFLWPLFRRRNDFLFHFTLFHKIHVFIGEFNMSDNAINVSVQ